MGKGFQVAPRGRFSESQLPIPCTERPVAPPPPAGQYTGAEVTGRPRFRPIEAITVKAARAQPAATSHVERLFHKPLHKADIKTLRTTTASNMRGLVFASYVALLVFVAAAHGFAGGGAFAAPLILSDANANCSITSGAAAGADYERSGGGSGGLPARRVGHGVQPGRHAARHSLHAAHGGGSWRSRLRFCCCCCRGEEDENG